MYKFDITLKMWNGEGKGLYPNQCVCVSVLFIYLLTGDVHIFVPLLDCPVIITLIDYQHFLIYYYNRQQTTDSLVHLRTFRD